ncbi:MAG TPA: Hpt domain-containing protein [Aestuariivirga sp.]|nr:Hpt domain-containing protein [Aestuariivirga sp.]
MGRRPKRVLASLEAVTEGVAALDRECLSHYTMGNEELAAEVVGLFLVQMPSILAMLRSATSPADWKFATHTLKGSAGAVGAMRITRIAAALEMLDIADSEARQPLVAALDAEVAAVREAAQSP